MEGGLAGRLHQTDQNQRSLADLPAANQRARVTSKIFHDKFIVLSQITANGHYPQAVLCGSTNFTENGVYRQANVVHVVSHPTVATQYLVLFDQIWRTPDDVSNTRAWINQHNPIDSQAPLYVGFSPRSGGADLAEFLNVIRSLDRDLLFAPTFRQPESILDGLIGAENDDVLRYGIQNSASRITGVHADRTARFAATALLTQGLEGWAKEGVKGQRENLLVHLKTIVANFTSDTPVVISGSHNLSAAASSGNDENYLIMRDDTDLADRYGLEILRFYEHYRSRYYAKLHKLNQVRPPSADDTWSNDYYAAGLLKSLSRPHFAGR